ncbi:MAG: 2-(1,2-epoxy-1,2-dihydrophenyl)acetyl-CoA isomerase PaaG [Proteobacteria bacterium]|nr:2-(1,2-epoxy-1,2-dihydrophenyl)acetyl-CoA isomerase PaaG [Pseudomonadota bacterium]
MSENLSNLLTIKYEKTSNIARIVLNRPDKLNAFSDQMHHDLFEVLTAVASDDSIRCVLISGEGRGFCAGQDLGSRKSADGEKLDLGDKLENGYNKNLRVLKSIKAPIICAVNGVAAGAGANIALNCDIVIAKKSAKFIQAFSSIGLVPDCNGSWLLPKLVGLARAKAITLLGVPVSAEQAEQWGMIYQAVDDEDFDDVVEKLLTTVAVRPTKALSLTKLLLEDSYANTYDQQLDRERDIQRVCGLSHDFAEGVDAFNNKRKPEFKGH